MWSQKNTEKSNRMKSDMKSTIKNIEGTAPRYLTSAMRRG